jgi:hypothetical protein
MIPGSVLFHRNFKFSDGESADKLLVVLSPAKNGQILAVKTTSQQKRRPLKDGCHPDTRESVFVFNANPDKFKETTWIILDPIVLEVSVLEKRIVEGIVSKLFDLNPTNAKAISNCLKRCDEVSPVHLEFLV